MLRVILGLHLVFAASFLAAAEISGIVTEVQDGDTLTLVSAQATYRVRLMDIDAPELAQTRGRDARTSLFQLCGLKQAVAETSGADRFGRTLATVTCAGVNVNAEMVRRGWAWVFRRYAPKGSALYGLETDARSDRRGLWADDAPIPPWEWRREKN
jgi:endonuclease YncB( thermonuclease family)